MGKRSHSSFLLSRPARDLGIDVDKKSKEVERETFQSFQSDPKQGDKNGLLRVFHFQNPVLFDKQYCLSIK